MSTIPLNQQCGSCDFSLILFSVLLFTLIITQPIKQGYWKGILDPHLLWCITVGIFFLVLLGVILWMVGPVHFMWWIYMIGSNVFLIPIVITLGKTQYDRSLSALCQQVMVISNFTTNIWQWGMVFTLLIALFAVGKIGSSFSIEHGAVVAFGFVCALISIWMFHESKTFESRATVLAMGQSIQFGGTPAPSAAPGSSSSASHQQQNMPYNYPFTPDFDGGGAQNRSISSASRTSNGKRVTFSDSQSQQQQRRQPPSSSSPLIQVMEDNEDERDENDHLYPQQQPHRLQPYQSSQQQQQHRFIPSNRRMMSETNPYMIRKGGNNPYATQYDYPYANSSFAKLESDIVKMF